MTIIVPKLNPSPEDKSPKSPTRLSLLSNNIPTKFDQDDNHAEPTIFQPLYQSSLKNTSTSISLVISKKTASDNTDSNDCTENNSSSSSIPGFGSTVKVVSHGRRRSVDKQYRPSQPTGNNNGGGRTSSRRSGRSYQYDNNSSNGNSGADGNGEDNDESDDDEDDEYIDEDDDEEEEEEEEEEEDEDEKNEDEEDDDQEKNNGVDNSIDEKVLASFGLKVTGESTVNLENTENAENDGNGPIPPGTPVTLQGIVCHETIGGVLVVNIKWRNKIYCGSLMDCTRHSWARPRFQSNDGSSHTGKTRMGKNIGRGKGKGKGKRLRSNSVTSTNSNNHHTVSPLKQKLRGRKKTMSGSSNDKRQGFRSSKRKPKNDDDSDDSSRPGKRSCTVKGAPSPTPSPTLIECPEPGCEKKYKHINGLRYHQAHAHLESKNQDDDNNSDDRSSTTPSPSEEFKEPDPLITVKSKPITNTTRSFSESSSTTSFNSLDKESSNDDIKPTKNPPDTTLEESKSVSDEPTCESREDSVESEDISDKPVEDIADKQEEKDLETREENAEEEANDDNEFVEVADKSTDTCTVTTASSYPCTKHPVITMATTVPAITMATVVPAITMATVVPAITMATVVPAITMATVPANELPEVADTQEVWETVLDSGCVTSAADSEAKKLSGDVADSVKQKVQDKGSKDEGQQVMITTSGINQLGIEVEDISENEEDIDPGQDIEFNSREEMEKAVENLQSGSFVASLSTENNLQMLSSLKDPSLIFGLTSRERIIDEKPESGDATETEHAISMETKQTESTGDSTKNVPTSSVLPCTMSVETLVSRSITASKHEPPLTNTDNPSSRFKYFPCRSYGDESYSVSNMSNANNTTLALIRDPELIKNDINHVAVSTSVINTNAVVDSLVESTKPSYTGSVGFNQDCTTSSIHSHGPKEELKKEHNSVGDIIKSHATITSEQHSSGHTSSSYTSPKSSTTTTYNTKLYSSHSETTNKDSKSRKMNNVGNIEKDNEQKDYSLSQEGKKTEETEKTPVVFVRQPSTLIPKHSRPSIPSLPVGVAHPYQYSSTTASASGLSSTSHTDLPQTDTTTPKSDEGESSKVLPKDRPVGEVGPVSVKRPAIHAGLPTVIPVGAPGLKTQASLHVPIRQGLKPPGLEDRASTPNSFRLAASSPRSTNNSPLPISPRLSPKITVSESKSSKHTLSSSPSKPSDADVVVVKQEPEPSGSKVSSREPEREKKTSPYEVPKEQLTNEQIQLYQQFHHRQMMHLAQQANMDPLVRYAYLRNFGYEINPWSMSPEQMKMMQQQRLRAAEEERMELQAAKRSKEESNNIKLDKRDSHSPMTSTPPRLERVMKDLSPGEGSRSITASSESSSRGMPCVDQPPEKKTKLEVPKNEETDRELQKLRHKRQEEYLSKQSMQHKFTMFKQLESAGGAAKTHSIPPLLESKDDYHKTKYPSTSTHPETLNQAIDKGRKPTSDPDDSNQLELSARARDPTRDVHSKAKRMMSSERGSFIPSQFQEYLKHGQMVERYEHSSSGNSLMVPSHLEASYVSSRIKDRDSTSPRPPRPRSPGTSHRTSPYKTDRPSSSQSISPHRLVRPSFSDVRGYSSSPSRSSVLSRVERSKSPQHPPERHKSEVYSSNSASSSARATSTDTSPHTSRADDGSPKHGGYRDRIKEDAMRPGIISNNLAVRRGDVTPSMMMQGHAPPDEELLRRHSYMMYSPYRGMMEHRQQQHAEQVYAMMSQQNAPRPEQYYSKRQ